MKVNHILGIVIVLLVIALGAGFFQGRSEETQEIPQNTNITNDGYTTNEANIIQSDSNDQNDDQMNTNAMTMETTKVTLTTTKGDIVLDLYTEQVPTTAGNFIKLAQDGFYDGVRFHRVIEGFMIQSGDPLSKDDSLQAQWGTGGPGYQFEDEFVEGLSNVPGTISMANAGPGTNGSQFFINTAANTFLDGKHSVFGAVVEGMDVVSAIETTETLPGDRPVEPITITKASVEV